MELIFDTHAHYDDESFDKDREAILSGLFENGVGTVMDVSANFDGIPDVLNLADQYDFIYAAVGVHPTEVYELEEERIADVERYIREGAAAADSVSARQTAYDADGSFAGPAPEDAAPLHIHPKVKAVGEIGLDYHYDDTDKEKQKKWFSMQIAMAKKLKLPIIVHSRDAAADTLEMIRNENAAENGLVMHCFSYEPEMARIYTRMGVYIGVGGVVTFKNARKLKEVVTEMPMELMLLETDCPYLAPEPYRGRRNQSALIKYVARTIAELRGMTPEDVIRITTENAKRFYKI